MLFTLCLSKCSYTFTDLKIHFLQVVFLGFQCYVLFLHLIWNKHAFPWALPSLPVIWRLKFWPHHSKTSPVIIHTPRYFKVVFWLGVHGTAGHSVSGANLVISRKRMNISERRILPLCPRLDVSCLWLCRLWMMQVYPIMQVNQIWDSCIQTYSALTTWRYLLGRVFHFHIKMPHIRMRIQGRCHWHPAL